MIPVDQCEKPQETCEPNVDDIEEPEFIKEIKKKNYNPISNDPFRHYKGPYHVDSIVRGRNVLIRFFTKSNEAFDDKAKCLQWEKLTLKLYIKKNLNEPHVPQLLKEIKIESYLKRKLIDDRIEKTQKQLNVL